MVLQCYEAEKSQILSIFERPNNSTGKDQNHMMRLSSPRVCRGLSLSLRVILLVSLSISSTGTFSSGSLANNKHEGSKARTPSTKTKGVPTQGLPDLRDLRVVQNSVTRPPEPLRVDQNCFDCDVRNRLTDDFAIARTEASNRTGRDGVDFLSRNHHWNVPLVSVPGRAGFDLDISISYDSLVWTKAASKIAFDADRGEPSPGFHLGFPKIQSRYFNAQANAYSYLLSTPGGADVELRQVGLTDIYKAVDGSLWRLQDRGPSGAVLRTSRGTELTFAWFNGQLQCVQMKDSNGNYMTIEHDSWGHLKQITDALGRIFNFNHDRGGNLISITQSRDGAEYPWATFGYSKLTVNTNFRGMDLLGPKNGSSIVVLSQIGLRDGTSFQFDYTPWAQVWRTARYSSNGNALSSTSYDLPLVTATAFDDCPRVSEQRVWAQAWNDEQEAVTKYRVDPDRRWSEVTLPNGVMLKQFFATDGWKRGLVTGTETWADGALQKWTRTAWTQDDIAAPVKLNPRPEEINIYDAQGNRRRSRVEYGEYGLPRDVFEYAADGETLLRRRHTDYNFDSTFIAQNIIGLVAARLTYGEQNEVVSKSTYRYDAITLESQSVVTQHDDTAFGSDRVRGRGLETETRQWDATDSENFAKSVASLYRYYPTGSLASIQDVVGRKSLLSYSDNFADKYDRKTFAYPTSIIDAAGNQSFTEYDYSTGAVSLTQDRTASLRREYDAAGRIVRTKNDSTAAERRWVYSATGLAYATFSRPNADLEEIQSYTVLDGAGRVRATALDLPGSQGGYSGSYFVYDSMGQTVRRSNPTEMTATWNAAGDDGEGWVWNRQEYDWKGRPTISLNPDGSKREAAYGGCGCAGGEVVTLTDEAGRSRRQSKDTLGRLAKVEELNWDESVYSTTEYSYNALDQMVGSKQSGQIRKWEFDGFGRISAEITPEQGRTQYEYYPDSSLRMIRDARGAARNFAYDSRGNLREVSFSAPADVVPTDALTYGYDSEDRVKWMQDGSGRTDYEYDPQGHLRNETKRFKELPKLAYTLLYEYSPTGGIKSVNTSWGEKISYQYDHHGRLESVFEGNTSLISENQYRAWGGIKAARYGNGRSLAVQYDERLRIINRDVKGVQGSEYSYDASNENTRRVTGVRDLYDSALDRSYKYDQVGRLQSSQIGRSTSQTAGNSVTSSIVQEQEYRYDVWGNLVERISDGEQSFKATYRNNQIERDLLAGNENKHDRAGNLTNDGLQQFAYDAAGQQRTAKGRSLTLTQDYDGNGLRVKKIEGNKATYYLRSSAFGNQVLADVNSQGFVVTSYVYSGANLLAINAQSGLAWVHNDPVTKSTRLTDSKGRVISGIELDPWGNEIAGTLESAQGPKTSRRFTTYERDANGSDDAMHRRYNSSRGRFEQPDPYRGSFKPADPQSLNRYAYTKNDPVNHTDPSGLMPIECGAWGFDDGNPAGWFCINYDPWGGYNPDPPPPPDPGAERPDLPDYAKRVYIDMGQRLTDCLNSVFSTVITGRNGVTTAGSNLFPHQQIRNAPYVDETQSTAQLGGYGLSQAADVNLGPNGTVHIGGDITDFSNSQGSVGAFELKERTYVHELGNILSRRISPDSSGTTFGDPSGISGSLGSGADYDTGAKLEQCVFGNVAP